MTFLRLVAATTLAAALAACGGVSSPSSYAPEDFTGILQPAGEVNRAFSVSGTGELQLELTALTPAPRVGFISMAVGRYVGSVCSPLLGYVLNQVGVNRPYALGRITRGSYCITVYDGNLALTAPAAFTVRILKP